MEVILFLYIDIIFLVYLFIYDYLSIFLFIFYDGSSPAFVALTFDPPGDARHEYPASGSRVRPGRDASIHFLEAGRRSHETRPLC